MSRKQQQPITKMYPQGFIDRVKAACPKSRRIHKLADAGSVALGVHLCDGMGMDLKPETLIKLLDDGNLAELRRIAEDAIERDGLYDEWGKIAHSGKI